MKKLILTLLVLGSQSLFASSFSCQSTVNIPEYGERIFTGYGSTTLEASINAIDNCLYVGFNRTVCIPTKTNCTTDTTDYCAEEVNFNYNATNFGTIMQMTIKNSDVANELHELLPYGDCYQGVCAGSYDSKSQEFVVNFDKKISNGHSAGFRAAQFSTFTTDNGTWLSVITDQKSFSFLFRGCYE